MKRYDFKPNTIRNPDDLTYGDYVEYDEAHAIEQERDALKAELALAKELLERWYNDSDIPESNCSCHISAPCNDCIEWSALRETAEHTERLLGVK